MEEIEAKIQETLATEEEAQQAVRKVSGTAAASDKRHPPSAVKSKGKGKNLLKLITQMHFSWKSGGVMVELCSHVLSESSHEVVIQVPVHVSRISSCSVEATIS